MARSGLIRRAILPVMFAAGIAVAAALAVHAGLAGVGRVLAQIGPRGLAIVCAIQLVTLVLCGLALRVVSSGVGFWPCLGSRWIRDGSSNLVAFIPAIGEVISARAMVILGGGGGQAAAASTVVDVAAETLSQALYAAAAFLLLATRLDPQRAVLWFAITFVAVAPLFVLFVLSRNKAILHWCERVCARIAAAVGFSDAAVALAGLAATIDTLNRQPLRVTAATVLHLAAWPMGAVAIWAASQALAHPLTLGEAVIIEAMAYAARSAAFLVPWGAGVQEGAFVGVGALLGVDAQTAIGLSLALRARDLVFGAPSLVFWYLAEGRRFWNRRQHA
jgi:putative membrane protein